MDRQAATSARLLPLLAVGALLAGLAVLSGCGQGTDAEPADAREALPSDPSPLALEALGEPLVERYRESAAAEGLDWTVLAAADQIELGGRGVGGGAEGGERIDALALTLRALGAPEDYRTALAERGGGRFARETLELAERYRDIESEVAVPADSGPLDLPAEGTVLAGYGPAFGILHDGLDIDADAGDAVRAAANGVAVSRGFHPVFGEKLCVLHRLRPALRGESRLTTCYGNLSGYEVEVGERIERGDAVGRAGCTGACLRPHIHFQVRRGSGATAPTVDPARFVGEEVEIPRTTTPLETKDVG